MKKIHMIMFVCLFIGCQKAELQETKVKEARSVLEEKVDSVEVNPVVNAKDWEGSIDVGFNF